MGYFSCAYGLFLPVFALSVTGMNTAVSALTAQALAADDTQTAQRTAKLARRMFGLGGFICSILLWILSEPLCTYLLHDPRAALAVRLFAPAVWICCMNAVLRGIHEGHHNMTPTAVSQVTEGIGRVICGLMLCRFVLTHTAQVLRYLPSGTTAEEAAAGAAIFGVTLSTALGMLTLLLFPKSEAQSAAKQTAFVSDRALRSALLRILLPVAAASLVTNLTTLIDLAAGLRMLASVIERNPAAFGLSLHITAPQAAETANFYYGAFSGLAVTVFNLVPSVTNMLGKGVFPAFAESCALKNRADMERHAQTVMQRTAFLAIPAGLGIYALAEPILQMLFASKRAEIAAAAPPLRYLGIAVIFAALSYPLFSMLQAAGHAGDTVTVMLWGAGVKLAGNLLLIPQLHLRGAAASTVLCYAVILLRAVQVFRRRTGTELHLHRHCIPAAFSGVLCAFAAQAAYEPLLQTFPQRTALCISIAAGGVIYLLSAWFLRDRRMPLQMQPSA